MQNYNYIFIQFANGQIQVCICIIQTIKKTKMKQLEETINDLYQNNGRKIHQMCDKRLRRFGGLAQKDYDDFYSATNEACIYGFREYKEGIIILASGYSNRIFDLSISTE